MQAFEYSTIGSRKLNEDAVYSSKIGHTLFGCVADGVGGIAHGEIASELAVEDFRSNLLANNKISFKEQLKRTNDNLELVAKEKYDVDMIATTFSGAYMNRKKIKGIHIGDSRVILVRDNQVIRLTEDQSEVGRLIREKKLDPKNENSYRRKNIIENVLGNSKYFAYQEFEKESQINDRVLISSDGFHGVISEQIILRLSKKYVSGRLFYDSLVRELGNHILKDNASFVLLEL